MTDSNELYNHFLWVTKKITNLLDNMTEDQFNQKSSEEERSVKEIILHLVSIYAYFSSFNEYQSIVEKSNRMDKKELLQLMRDLSKKVYTVLENEPKKMIPVKTKNGIKKNITGFSLFYMLTDHFAYHRGQIVTKFKMITGKDGVGTDYASFLTEDNPDFKL